MVGRNAGALAGRLYGVTGDSMAPAFRPGDHLLVGSVPRRPRMISRGAPVIVEDPRVPARRYLKRIVGLPGEEVRLRDGMLFIDGAHLAEPYLGGLPATPGLVEMSWKLGDDECFVMGDNRAHSTDSREFGPVPIYLIVGRVRLRWWPPGRWGRVT